MQEDFDKEQPLDEVTLRKIEIIRDTLLKIAEQITAPIDPKVIALLEMSVDMLEEQVIMDKVYEYPDCPNCEAEVIEKPNLQMLFFNEQSAPSTEDLENMFDTSWMKDDDK